MNAEVEFDKIVYFCLSDKHETGSEAEMNHVHKNPLLCFGGCHKWNGECIFFTLLFIPPELEEISIY